MEKLNIETILKDLGIKPVNSGATTGSSRGWINTTGKELVSYSPINGEPLAAVLQAGSADYEAVMAKAQQAFLKFRMIPAPRRGEIIREIASALREKKETLGALVTLETGKIKSEGQGEERPFHRMYEQWHPLGIIGIITAFNFPVAVWSWNALIAAVCGDVNLFKPSSKTPLTAIAIQNIIAPVVDRYDIDGVFNMIIGDRNEVGDPMLNDKRIPLISATGSTGMGIKVATSVAARLGRSLLELGGNNAIIITEDADLDMALRAVLFGAVGTAGQRCTSTRRIIVHQQIKEKFTAMLVHAYGQIRIGHPMADDTLMGPLIDDQCLWPDPHRPSHGR